MRSISGEAYRYFLAGVINTLVTYIIYLLILEIADYRIAYTTSFLGGVLLGYGLNALFVFNTNFSWSRLIQYPLLYVLQYVSGLLLLAFLVDELKINIRFAPFINVMLLTPITFIMNRWFLLRKGHND